MTVSIIIAVKIWQRHLEECIRRCQELDFSDFEIIVLPDSCIDKEKLSAFSGKVALEIISTGEVTPARKRDMALASAKGEILAFIDDDAYPEKNWLTKAMLNFNDSEVACVGGPAVTPYEDNLRQRASGKIFASFLVSGNFAYRYLPVKKKEVDDYPSCNFLMRKSVMLELGGFNTNFWPGEDTKLCLDVTRKLGKKIIYDPEVLVYHHRREVFLAHIKQVASYALHRGYFVKRYPETSLRLPYFIPSIFLVSLITGGLLSIGVSFFRPVYFTAVSLYLFTVLIFSISKELGLIPLVFSGIILSHIYYGAFFLKGLCAKRLKEE